MNWTRSQTSTDSNASDYLERKPPHQKEGPNEKRENTELNIK